MLKSTLSIIFLIATIAFVVFFFLKSGMNDIPQQETITKSLEIQ